MKLKTFVLTTISMLLLLNTVHAQSSRVMDRTTRLSALCRVWGFLKYYHPEVAKGQTDWDAVLISTIPDVKDAERYNDFNRVIRDLIDEAGPYPAGEENPENNQVENSPYTITDPLFLWIEDRDIFKMGVIQKLRRIKKDHVFAENFYVGVNPYSGGAYFSNENPYDEPGYPNENYRLLALFRYWNIIQYYYPYRDDISAGWEEVAEEFIPRLIDAANALEYHLAIRELTTRIDDGHAFCNSDVLKAHLGSTNYCAPFIVRYIEDKTVVTRVFTNLLNSPEDVKIGDIITKYNGIDADTFRENIRKYAQGSNEPGKESSINRYITMGTTGQLNYTILRDGGEIDVTVNTYPYPTILQADAAIDEAAGRWKILPGNIAYVNLAVFSRSDFFQAVEELETTDAIIFDVRNYPQWVVYYLGMFLNPEARDFVSYSLPDFESPGTYYTKPERKIGLAENPDYYKGKVIIMVDERTISSAEFTCMGLQTAPDATVIGSQTAGADGDITSVKFPGGITTYFSGIGVYYPDGAPTQRVGIVPDIYSGPTIEGIREGRDEVLERAIQFIENNE